MTGLSKQMKNQFVYVKSKERKHLRIILYTIITVGSRDKTNSFNIRACVHWPFDADSGFIFVKNTK